MLGLGTTSGDWSATESAQIGRVINDGYREFIMAHDWNFLRPTQTATLVSGTATFSMPDNFSGIILAPFTYAVNAGGPMTGVQYITDEQMRQLQSAGTTSSPPQFFSMRILNANPAVDPTTASTRWQANFWPTPNSNYVLTYQYQILPGAFTSSNYPYGGMLHMSTIQAFVCAAAKMEADGEIGEWEAKKQQLLARSIEIDRQTNPVFRGMMTDGRYRNSTDDLIINSATYQGVLY